MKTAILLSMVFLLRYVANCQDGKKDFFMLQIGAAFPVGQFGDNNYESDDPGFAVTGINAELHYVHALSRKWGYLIALKGNSFPFDEKAFLYENGYVGDGTTIISTDNYNIYGLYSGIYYKCLALQKFALQINGMVGFNIVSYPRMITETKGNVYSKSVVDADNTTNFSWAGKASALFFLSEKFELSANLGFMHTRATYDIEWSAIFGSQSWSGKKTYGQPIGVIDLAIGLNYML